MKLTGATTVKPSNDIFDNNVKRQNEDTWHFNNQRVAVADGAGGIGIFAREWAETLTLQVPQKPFKNVSNMNRWIAGFWEIFYQQCIDKLNNDPWKIKKLDNEGSFATLSELWKIKSGKFVYQSVGDTALFIVNWQTGKLTIQDNLKQVNHFTGNPPLLNWQIEKIPENDFFQQKINLQPNEEILLATDGIALYIWTIYLLSRNRLIEQKIIQPKVGKIIDYFSKKPVTNFIQWLNKLKQAVSKGNENFAQLTNDWYHDRGLPNDDYTLIFITND